MSLSKLWLGTAGIVLIAVGALGFISNPLVGSASGALVPTDALHNIVHLGTGALALALAAGLLGSTAQGALGFGILYVVIFLAVVVSPTLFGLFSVAANPMIHVIHAALALVSLGAGYLDRDATMVAAR